MAAKKKEESTEEEDLATAIRNISTGVRKLRKSGLNERAIVVLLHDSSRVWKPAIREVLDSLEDLAKKYTKKGN